MADFEAWDAPRGAVRPSRGDGVARQASLDSIDPMRDDVGSGAWAMLAAAAQRGDPASLEELYAHVERWTRASSWRWPVRVPMQDRAHEVYTEVLDRLRKGELRDPKLLAAFVFGVLRNLAARDMSREVRGKPIRTGPSVGPALSQRGRNPEKLLAEKQRRELGARRLKELSSLDREVLVRFYLLEQDPARIRAEMNLTEAEFREYKCRALTALAKLRGRSEGT
jgi:DNA-directed RNA polymerase specialized sigma24 family protein